MPIVSETLPGNTADAKVYVSTWKRMGEVIGHTDFITVGDSKLTSLENQARIDKAGGYYLGPLSWASVSKKDLLRWIQENDHQSYLLSTQKENEEPIQYFEVHKVQRWEDPASGEDYTFSTRYLVVHSPRFADVERKSFNASLENIEKKLTKLQYYLSFFNFYNYFDPTNNYKYR